MESGRGFVGFIDFGMQKRQSGFLKEGLKNIKPDWSQFELRPTWSVITSRELSLVLNVSLQTICNWKLRNILPEPEPHTANMKGNKNYYRISKIKAWLECRTEEEVHWEFINKYMGTGTSYRSLEQAKSVAMVCYQIFEIEKPII